MSDATLRLVERLRQRIRETRRRLYLSHLSRGGVVTAGAAAGALLIALILEAYFWLPVPGRWLLITAVGAAALVPLALLVGRPLAAMLGVGSGMSDEALARIIGERFTAVGDRLINLLHLAEGRGSISDPELREEAIRNLNSDVGDVPFEEMASYQSTRQALRWAAIPVAGLLLLTLAAPSMVSQAGNRLFSPGTAFERPAAFAWTVSPGDSTLVKGNALTIKAQADGSERPQTAVLHVQRANETVIEKTELPADSAHTFRHRQTSVRESMRYRIEAGRVSSPWYTVDVVNRPLVRQLRVSLTPPAYTGLPDRTLAPNVGDISALPGTRVAIDVTSDSNQIAAAHLAFENGDTTELSIDGTRAAGSFPITEETAYQIRMRSKRGIPNGNPIEYRIKTLTDETPTIELEEPDAVSDIEQSGQKTLEMRMTDDYGFHRLRLYYRLAESRFDEAMSEFRHIGLPLQEPDRLDQALEYTWRIAEETELDPVRGDVVEYYVQVWDNNAVAGYQSAKTATQVLRYPSLAQQYENLNQEQESVASSLRSLREDADAMHKQFQSLQEDVRRQQDSNWDNQRSLEQLQERQKAMEKQAEQISRQVEQMTQQMEQENLVSDRTMQMYEELQNVVEEIDSPELQKALQKLQEAMQNMDFESMQQAMQNFEFNEQDYQRRLERTLELFKKLRTQQQLDEVARRTSALAEQERKLAEQTERLASESESEEANNRADESDETSDAPGRSDEKDPSSQRSEDQRSASAESSQRADSTGSEEESVGQSQDSDRTRTARDSTARRQSRDQRQRSSAADSSGTPPSPETLAEQQDKSRQDMESIEQRMEEVRQQMQEMQQSPKQQFQQMQEQMQRQNLPQQMQQNSEQLREGQLNKAQQGQRSMQQQLQKLSQQMSQMQQSMQSQRLQVNIAGLRQALEDVLHLSTEQENLRRSVDNVADDSPVLREVSQKQVSLSEGLSTVNDSLQSLAGNIPRMSRRVQQRSGEALRAMSQSVAAIGERNLSQTTSHQKGAMEHLNNLALDLSQLLEQLQNMQQQGGGGSMSMQQMMQQMQQMAGQQKKLNQQIQQLLNDIQGDRLSQSQQQRLQQMRRQQQQIRRQLEKIRRGGGEGDMLGDLEKVAEQMEESIRELRERSVSREMVERQQQILARLLQAQQSLQTQGREEQRRSQTGEQRSRRSPDPLAPTDQAEQLRKDLLRALESDYAPDYEELIKRYFQVLQERDTE